MYWLPGKISAYTTVVTKPPELTQFAQVATLVPIERVLVGKTCALPKSSYKYLTVNI